MLRVGPLNESIQDPGVDPGFNREGIAFYPTPDGGSMIVQFSGVEAGAATPITKILVPKPAGVTSLMGRGTLRVEDYGTSLYVFYNGAPYIRIDLGDNTGSVYTSGTVYNSGMIVQGTFSGMEVEVLGKVVIAQRDAALRLYSATMQIVAAQGDMLSDRPVASFDKIEQTTFNTWNETTFKNTWDKIGTLGASNVVTGVDGHLMLGWLEPRVIATKSVYTIPNIVEVELGFPSASASAGVAIRVDPAVGIENIQEPGEILINPIFNREGIMFFAKPDGSGMFVQFSGAISAGDGYLTPLTRIAVAAPAGVNLRDRGILRIEDFGTAIYVFYNDIPFLRVNLEGKVGVNYTSGSVYNAKMTLQGVFSGMEIIESGKVGIAARQGDLTTESLDIYRITIKTPANVSDAPTDVTAVADNKQATVSFSAPINNGGAAITKYTVTSSPDNYKQSGTSSPLVVTRLSNGTTYTFTVVATNVVGNSLASAESNSVTPATVSSAPTDVTAAAGNNQATVSFSAPLNDGGSAIINYTATSNPGNYTQTGSTSPLVVTGLNNGTAYTFTIVATNTVGNSIESAVSNEVTPLLTSINSNLESAVKVYQAGSAIVVELNGLSGVQNVYLIDIMGKTVVSKKSFGGEKLEISNRLISGVYFVRILGATKTQVTSIIIK